MPTPGAAVGKIEVSMRTSEWSLPNFSGEVWQALLLLVLAPLIVFTVCFRGGTVPLIFELSLLVILIATSKLKAANLVISYIIADHLCQFLKRVIFTLGPQTRLVYYGFQLLPTVILMVAGMGALTILARKKLPLSAKIFVGYIFTSVAASLINFRAVALISWFSGLGDGLILFGCILIGMSLPFSIFRRFSYLFIFFIVVSVVYGMFQFFTGPTVIDRAWATATHDYSIEGYKVYDKMYGHGSDFRPFSYYADHTTWGLFMALACIVLFASVSMDMLPKKALYFVVPFALVGLVICETRTPWLAFLAALVVQKLITRRALRRPMLLILGVIASFGIVVSLGTYMTQHFYFGFANSILNRYATVGTMEARTSAWRLFVRNLPAHWLVGTGFGYASSDPSVSMAEEIYSHNMFVSIMVVSGLPGLILFLTFFYQWIKEAFWVASRSSTPVAKATIWMIALTVGMLLTGNVQGPLFMSNYLCILLGMVSGEWIRLRAEQSIVLQFARQAAVSKWNTATGVLQPAQR